MSRENEPWASGSHELQSLRTSLTILPRPRAQVQPGHSTSITQPGGAHPTSVPTSVLSQGKAWGFKDEDTIWKGEDG